MIIGITWDEKLVVVSNMPALKGPVVCRITYSQYTPESIKVKSDLSLLRDDAYVTGSTTLRDTDSELWAVLLFDGVRVLCTAVTRGVLFYHFGEGRVVVLDISSSWPHEEPCLAGPVGVGRNGLGLRRWSVGSLSVNYTFYWGLRCRFHLQRSFLSSAHCRYCPQQSFKFHIFWEKFQGVRFPCLNFQTFSSALTITASVAYSLSSWQTTSAYDVIVPRCALASLNDNIKRALIAESSGPVIQFIESHSLAA